MLDRSASVFCFTPLRVPVSELGRLATGQPMSSASSPASSPPPACSAPPLPQSPCPVCPRLEQEFEPWRQAAYWKAMHRRALEREAQLQAEIQRLEALLRLREQQLFGRKTETAAAIVPSAPDTPTDGAAVRRPRGQRRGRPGPRRRDYSHLPDVVEDKVLPPDQCRWRGVVSLSPISRAPRIPPSWRSTSGPIAESFAGAVIDRLARVVLIPASSPPRHRPG